MTERIKRLFAAFTLFAAASLPALASANGNPSRGVDAPELDPTSAAAAIALLAGGALLVHRARKRA